MEVSSADEIGQLARAFNRMTRELVAQRERLVQAERVAAWRELARRLAHELKNPLFPLQITVENMQRARERYPEQFDEVFREGTATLLAELAQLKQIVGRFSDFAQMPAPEMQPVDFNELVAETLKLFAGATGAGAGSSRSTELDAAVRTVQVDPEQMTRVLRNLMLNAMDAMPEGGTLTVRTAAHGRRRAAGDLRHRPGADAGRMRAPVHAVLHDQDARHGAGPGDRAIAWSATTAGGSRWRAKRARARRSASNFREW